MKTPMFKATVSIKKATMKSVIHTLRIMANTAEEYMEEGKPLTKLDAFPGVLKLTKLEEES